MSKTKKMLSLALFGVTGPEQWQTDLARVYDWRKPDLMRDVALLAERAKFDLLLIGDGLMLPTSFRGSLKYPADTGIGVALDPLVTLGMLSGPTQRIGLGCTISTTFTPPYSVARQMSSLDHISEGRAAWNIVTSAQPEAGDNYGYPLPEHDLRYEMADEHVEICRRLWDSWDDDAIVEDREVGIFADHTKIHHIDFEGQYYRSKGPLNVPRSPQGRPVMIAAGTSPRGRRFAAEHADMVIAHLNTVEDMRSYTDAFKKDLQAAGRDRSEVIISVAIRPWIGKTAEEALAKQQRNKESARLDEGLAWMSMVIGHDFSEDDLDKPLDPNMKVNNIIGALEAFTKSSESMTLREIALHVAQRETFPLAGTPEEVADALESAAEEADLDGFHFRYTLQDFAYMTDVASMLVPVLQDRGLHRREYSGSTLREHLFG